MIAQISNNKPSGTYQTGICEAGTPISGVTADGRYNILRVNVNGSILTNEVNPVSNYIGFNTATIITPAAAPPANTYVGTANQPIPVFSDGLYRINPTYIYAGAAGGGISFILYKDFTNLSIYLSALPAFNAFNPGVTDINQGLYGFWHNTASQSLGGTLQTSYNRDNTQDVYLTGGSYYMAIVTDGAVIFTGGPTFVGFYEFTKIG